MEKIKYYTKITLDGQEDNLKEGCNIFLQELSKNYENFTKKLSDNQEKWKNYLNQENVIFIPQEIAIKSPTTIIDAPWGLGKTYFIEQVAKYFLDNKKKIDKKIKFEKIIILDTWKYSSMENVAIEVMAELFYILVSKSKKLEETWVKIGKSLFNNIALSLTNKLIGTKFKEIEINKSFEDLLKDLDKNNETVPTIIFFDNVERLEEKSWDILKAIQKLSSLSNFCFVLPMSLEKFNNNWDKNKNELPIEKYIKIPYFKLDQNFIGLLKVQGFDDEFCQVINSFLQEPIDNYYLSIRRAEELMSHYKFFDVYQKEGVFSFLASFAKIWNSEKSINKYLKGYLDQFLDSRYKQQEIFIKLQFELIEIWKNLKSKPQYELLLREKIMSELNNLIDITSYGSTRQIVANGLISIDHNNDVEIEKNKKTSAISSFWVNNFWHDWNNSKILNIISNLKSHENNFSNDNDLLCKLEISIKEFIKNWNKEETSFINKNPKNNKIFSDILKKYYDHRIKKGDFNIESFFIEYEVKQFFDYILHGDENK